MPARRFTVMTPDVREEAREIYLAQGRLTLVELQRLENMNHRRRVKWLNSIYGSVGALYAYNAFLHWLRNKDK